MSRLCLCLARFLLAAWVGAAILFVVNGVATVGEVSSADFDRLTAIRFPNYYVFGFVAVGVGFVALLCSMFGTPLPRWRHGLAVFLVAAALGVMAYDHQQVYQPLEEMITPPGQARPMGFVALHEKSKHVNSVHISLCLVAGLLICCPPRITSRDAGAPE